MPGKHYDLDTDVTLSGNDDKVIASQKATKTYVDTEVDKKADPTIIRDTNSDISVKELVINRLTNEEYDVAVKEDDQLYLTPDTTDQDIADAVSAHNTSNSAHSTLLSNYLKLSGGTLTNGSNQLKIANTTYASNLGTYVFDVPGQYFRIYNQTIGNTKPAIMINYQSKTTLIKGSLLKNYDTNTEAAILDFSDRGIANGVASLDANIKVPVAQIPDLSSIYLTSHQDIKTLKTDNTTGQTVSSSETIAGSGTINLHKVSKTGSYSDLLNKPTIPTVNNNTITIQKNSTTVDSFTLNQSTDKSINISVPTTVAELSDSNNYVQTSSLEEAATVAKTGDYNDLINKPTIPQGTVTSVRVQATSPVVSSQNTAQTGTLNTTISLADAYGDTKNPYGSKTANTVLAAPNGSNGAPSFRALVKADIPLASETAASGGTTTSLVTTGEKYTWNSKQDALAAQTAYTSKGSATKVPQITTNSLGQVTGITEVTISQPTVNNKTITIQKNSTTVDSFTLNQSTDKTINITVPTKTSDITNDSGFLTSHQTIKTLKTDNTTGQTASSSEAVAGSGTINLHKISKTGSYNDLLDKPTIDTALSTTSTNTVQNKIITTELNKKIQQNDILQDLNPHALQPRFRFFSSTLNNVLYKSDKRHTVTLTNFNTSNSSTLFDMNFDSNIRVLAGKIGTVNITGSTYNIGMDYPYGWLYVSFYGSNGITDLSQISAKVYQDWSGHNTGWVDITNSRQIVSSRNDNGTTRIYTVSFYTQNYGLRQIEISIDNTDGVGKEDTNVWVTQIEFFCQRTGVGSFPILTKLGGTVNGNITIPTTDGSFIGNLTGNATSATKATKDGDNNTISSTYLKLSGGTLTGAVNTANNTLNKIGDDAYIGDVNIGGCIGIKGQNGATGIVFKPYSGSTDIKMTSNGSGTLTVTGTISSTFSGDLTGTASRATADADGNTISTTYLKTANLPTKLSDFTDDLGSSPTHTHSQYLTDHQTIKTLKTTNTTAQSTSASETITGSGTINLHKIAKTGTFSDLLSKPTSLSGYGITDAYTKTEVDGMISSVYKPAGSVAFASLPTLSDNVLGNVYNVTDAFTTTANFVEGAGKSYPAGTNVVVVNTGTTASPIYKFDVLAGFVDLSGYVPTSRKVNGKALSADITISKSDVGLGNVDNTADLDKPISTATQTALDGKENTISDLSKIRSGANSFYVKGTQTASTNAFTGVLSAVSELYEGLTIDYWLPFAGTSTAATLNLTLAGGTTTGAVNCYYSGTTRLTTHLSANCVGRLIYQTVIISGTSYTGWWLLKAYYTDSNTHDRSLDNYYRAYAGAAIPKYALVMKGLNGRLYSLVTSYGTATNKVITTVGLRPDKIWMYNGNAAVNAGAIIPAQQLYRDFNSTAGSSYFNASLPTYCDIYLCGDYNEDTNLFYLATTDASGNASTTDFYRFIPYNTEPTYSDYFITGRYYIFLGSSYSTAQYFQLMDQHELYYYDGTNLIRAVDKPKYAATFVDWSE